MVSNDMSPVSVPSSLAKRLVLIIGDRLRADLLISVMEHSGAFGVSHARVPTLTRPGHVAIIGERFDGYWDVEFDSIFNQPSTKFSFGFPGVQSMFSRRAAPGKIRDWYYEDNASALDFWVLENLEKLFRSSTDDPILASQLNADKNVFFLRLGGLDITGHSYRPHSKEHMNNIQAVDRIVRAYSQTSFLFTADHGMSVTSVHGDGHPDNIRTPLIAWGAGIRADITAMATLLGLQWPAHSVGILPDADSSRPGYLALSAGEETVARASLANANANALLEHYHVKHETNQGRRLFYKPFERLEGRADVNIAARASTLQRAQTAMGVNDWKAVHNESLVLIQAALEGLRYLQTYDSFLIHVIVTAGYVGWAAYSSLYISRPLDQSLSQRASPRASTIITVLVTLVLCCSWTAYAHGEIWVYALVTAGVVWPLLAWPRNFLKKRVGLYLAWASSCSTIALFHTPVDAKENLPKLRVLYLASPLLAIVLGAKSDNALEKTTAYLIGFGVWFVVLSVNAEGLFYLAYAMTLQIWIEVETNLRNEQHVASSGEYRSLRLDDTRIAVFFLFFVQFAFFGAGKSFRLKFSPSSHPFLGLVITFKPFLVFGLLADIPYVIVSVSLATLNARPHLPPSQFCFRSRYMVTSTLFYQPVSCFCVMSLLLLWSTGICAAGEYLMADSFRLDREKVY
ncbi:hypothetical protein BDN71DRAFT_1479720 [Pleurotus eryngii]|uniref:GPI ethanolamine phosphate transferase 1 n=1 Tax=Pleurotus eryngii TaxID=5323 RepID=A0A9P6DJM7_PLEER|nr:hypothetical protein BDN71DRAFT_1479720 [Pleurotus eryngii]